MNTYKKSNDIWHKNFYATVQSFKLRPAQRDEEINATAAFEQQIELCHFYGKRWQLPFLTKMLTPRGKRFFRL